VHLPRRWKRSFLVPFAIGGAALYVVLGGYSALVVLGRLLSFVLFFLGVIELFMALYGETPIYIRLPPRGDGLNARPGRTLTISRFLIAALLIFVALVLVYGPPTLQTPR